ncbi:lipoprotein N-acyltransferase Lnb domain-containing protein [Pedobacter sp. NJ-S-72]
MNKLIQKYLIILLVFILSQNKAGASTNLSIGNSSPLSESSSVSVLTCGKTSKYLYALFGHSAIRIRDTERQMDLVYNYGTFDNDDPDFYINFINGRMKYSLSVSDYSVFLQEYMINGQAVSAQPLNLTLKEKNKLFALINEEIKPANKFYYYDFVRHNCATKIRDLLIKTIGPDFERSLSAINKGKGNTIREMVSNYLKEDDLYMFGMNVLLGKKTDTVSDKMISLFLPDTLGKRLDYIQLRNTKLSGRVAYLFEPDHHEGVSLNSGFFTNALYCLSLILLMTNLLIKEKSLYLNNLMILITIVIFTVISLAGCLLIYLSVFSSLELVKYNLNILWCHPFYLYLLFKKLRKILLIIFLTGILLFILIYFHSTL